jgi:hypothetical protein
MRRKQAGSGRMGGEKRSCCDGHTGGIVCGSATIKTEQDNH